MSSTNTHDDWLALIDISGPFLAVPVLKEAFPQGLDELDGNKRRRLRQAYDEWCEALETDDPQFPELHAAWINEVLSRGLELDEDGRGETLKREIKYLQVCISRCLSMAPQSHPIVLLLILAKTTKPYCSFRYMRQTLIWMKSLSKMAGRLLPLSVWFSYAG